MLYPYKSRHIWPGNGKQCSCTSGFRATRKPVAEPAGNFPLAIGCCRRLQIRDTPSSGGSSRMPTIQMPAARFAVRASALSLAAVCWITLLLASIPAFALPNAAHPPHTLELEIDTPEADVLQAVQAATEDPIVHGTYSYEKEKILLGARPSDLSAVFGKWDGPGKAFYKVDANVIAPRYFEDTGDIGTITVRYIVHGVSESRTDLRIDAVFVDARRAIHWSEGGVESAEYGAIQQQIRQLKALRRQPRQLEESSSRPFSFPAGKSQPRAAVPSTGGTGAVSAEQELEQHVSSLRHQLERRVKAEGAQLKSSPFQSATTVENLPPNSDVLLLVVTPYWYGIETEAGHHGWVHHSQLETLP